MLKRFFTKKADPSVVSMTFKKGNEVPYKEVQGFFMYNDEIFYKIKNSGGKNVKTQVNFTDYVLQNTNVSMTTKEISAINVVELTIE